MKKIISWVLTLAIISLLILITERIFIYNIVYKHVMKDVELKNDFKKTNYTMHEGDYVVLFDEVKIEKNLYNQYNLSECKIEESRFLCDNDFYIFKAADELKKEVSNDGYYDVHKFYNLKTSVINSYLLETSDTIFDSYSIIGRSEFKKVNFFSSSEKIKEAITHNYIKMHQAAGLGNSYYFGEYDLVANDYKYKESETSRYSLSIKGDNCFYYMQTKNYDLFKSLIGRIKTSE